MRTSTLSPIVSRRGVARVSAVWMIVVVVLLFVVMGYAYIAQDEAAASETARKSAVADKTTADQALLTRTAELAERSGILGFTTDPATIPSNVDTARATLAELKAAFPDMEPVTTFEAAVPSAIQSYQTKLAKIAELEASIQNLTSQLSSERDAKDTLEGEKDTRISDLEQQLADAQETSRSEISRLESTVSDLNSRIRTSSDQIVSLQDEKRTTERTLEEERRNAASTKGQYTKRLNDITRRSEKADGEISAVLPAYGVGFINLSASDRLSEGITFRIVSGKPGADTSVAKARARVINVGPRFSEVEIFDVADAFQPVVAGDRIYNPLYEKKGERNAVLAGSISGAYNEPELRLLLANIGINIQNEISNTTDFLITGGPLFADEDGEPLEEPLQVDQLPVYGEARDQGITIVPIRDVLQYFEQ